jgi:hypothetical protein
MVDLERILAKRMGLLAKVTSDVLGEIYWLRMAVK